MKLQVLVAIDELPEKIWTNFSSKMEIDFVRDGWEASRMLKEKQFQVVFLDIFLHGIDGLQLLQKLEHEKAKPALILTSEAPNFQYARQGLLYGASDYLLRPLTLESLTAALERVWNSRSQAISNQSELLTPLIHALGSEAFGKQMAQALTHVSAQYDNPIESGIQCRSLYHALLDRVFATHPWLSLYQSPEECSAAEAIYSSDADMLHNVYLERAAALNALFCKLYPALQDTPFQEILEYMLGHVDDIYSQKEIAQHFFLSASTLSERFLTRMNCRYREYRQLLILRRAAYLLRSTDCRIYEICTRLGIKDVNHFSRQFRQQLGVSIADYRKESSWDFQI